ncbi:MAG: hypothetical protein C0602_11115 [Denitrovibrio sp.]|nr:MAG: hypothetical protein C0602_11115 [Denitrovibrio sp.]
MDEHILHSFILDNDGKWINLNKKMPEDVRYKFHWLHLHRESVNTQKWLYEADFDEMIIDSLTDSDTRPRTTVFPDGVLLNMRVVNTDNEDYPHNMLSMRLFIEKNRIVSTSLKDIHILKDIIEVMHGTYPPTSKNEFLSYMIELITDRIEPYVAENREIIFDMECNLIDDSELPKQSTISEVRRSVITFARYLAPQKEALMKLMTLKEHNFSQDDKIVVTESINSTRRYLEDLESTNNRCHIMKDDISALSAEKMNRNMYMLSIVTAVFLPLSFLTGLLGINVGGIPGSDNPHGFRNFSLILIAVFILQFILIRISRKFK